MVKRSGQIFSKTGDRRFRETEETIFYIFADPNTEPSVENYTSRAGISSSTFYRHHKSVYSLLHDYERIIMKQFRQFMHETVNFEKVGFRQIVYRMLIFIIINRDVIRVVASRDNFLIIYYMVSALKDKAKCASFQTEATERIFDIYAFEICGVIKNWHEDGYPECVLPKIEKDILYLTSTINERLGKLVN